MTDTPDPKAINLLLKLLASEERCLRGAAAFGLSLAGPDAKPALHALSEALRREEDTEVARAIVFALEDLGVEAAPGLVAGLRHPDAEIRMASEEALSTLALAYRESGREVPELTEAFAQVPELRELMIPLGEYLGFSPRPPEELLAPVLGEPDTFKAIARKRELAAAMKATKRPKDGPH